MAERCCCCCISKTPDDDAAALLAPPRKANRGFKEAKASQDVKAIKRIQKKIVGKGDDCDKKQNLRVDEAQERRDGDDKPEAVGVPSCLGDA